MWAIGAHPYELHAINDFLKHAIPRKRPQYAVYNDKKCGIDDEIDMRMNEDLPIALRAITIQWRVR